MDDELYCPKCLSSWNENDIVISTYSRKCMHCNCQLIARPGDSHRTALYMELTKMFDKYRLQSWDVINIIDQVREIEQNAVYEANYGYFKETPCRDCGNMMLPRMFGNSECVCSGCLHESDEYL